MISICITIKNRSRILNEGKILELFPRCVNSIKESVTKDIPCEVVVTDWNSDDWPLHEWLEQALIPIPVQIIPISGAFSRGRGLNIAAKSATGESLLFTDADCLLCSELLISGIKYLEEGKTFFPVLFSFKDPEHTSGWWRHEGYGNCMISKEIYEITGGWPEYNVWGKEDNDFHAIVLDHTEVIREEVQGFFHQWHPNDIVWKNKFSERIEEIAFDSQQFDNTIQDILDIIPSGGTFLLADEARFSRVNFPNINVIPFTEIDGVYGGRPANSKDAINELSQYDESKVNFMIFTYTAFWWLDYYSEMFDYLKLNFDCLLKNDRLVVFKSKRK